MAANQSAEKYIQTSGLGRPQMSTGASITEDAPCNDQVVQETPVVARSFWGDSELLTNDNPDFKGKQREDKPIDKTTSLPPEDLRALPVSRQDREPYDFTPPVGSPASITKDNIIRYNKRTPNLEKIAKFFTNGRSPSKENLLKKFEISHLEDTPESQRKSHLSKAHVNGRSISSTEFVAIGSTDRASRPSNSNDSDMELVMARSDDEGLDDGQNEQSGCQQKFRGAYKPTNNIADVPILNAESSPLLNRNLRDKLRQLEGTDHPIVDAIQEIAPQTPTNVGYDLVKAAKISHHVAGNTQRVISDTEEAAKGTSSAECTALRHFSLHGNSANLNSGFLSFPGKLNEDSDDNKDEVSANSTRVDDTTAEVISPPWILRPNNGAVFNSNKSTQIINVADTQRISSQSEIPSNGCGTKERMKAQPTNYEETQLIASYTSQSLLSGDATGITHRENALTHSTQVIKSQDNGTESDLNTPNLTKILFEPIMEIPETSSPSKSKEDRHSASLPSSHAKAQASPESLQKDDSQEKVHLKISSKTEALPTPERDSIQAADNNNDFDVVISEAEYTQDLPEVEEEVSQEVNEGTLHQFDANERPESYTVFSSKSPKRTHKELTDFAINEELKLPYSKKRVREMANAGEEDTLDANNKSLISITCGTPLNNSDIEVLNPDGTHCDQELVADFPTHKLSEDKRFLSKSDIKFEDAVWCQYSLDYNYYPGRILSSEVNSDSSWVYFDTGKSLTKNDDVYYLDIRVGDIVNVKGKTYVVIALECTCHDLNTIRCIRGYDTVHLKKKNKSGKLAKRTLVKRLAEVSLELKEWTRRPKVILENDSKAHTMAHEDLQHPIRGRKNTAKLSPTKLKSNGYSEDRPIYREDSYNDNIEDLRLDTCTRPCNQRSPILGMTCNDKIESKFFNECLFVFTGFGAEREELSEVVRHFGGDILDDGFSNLFSDDGKSEEDNNSEKIKPYLDIHIGKNSKYSHYKFACLITTQYSRSLKYLETLALRWPTLHWKFIKECARRNELAIDSLYQYLLPSGESYRLSINSGTGNGVVKSNNVIKFYGNLLLGKKLNEQVAAMKSVMQSFTVIIYGHSNLDNFVKFSFSCLGVVQLHQISSIDMTAAKPDFSLGRLADILDKTTNSDILIYVNKNNGISTILLDDLRREISRSSQSFPNMSLNIHVETKEWLIQTIINESIEFLDGQ